MAADYHRADLQRAHRAHHNQAEDLKFDQAEDLNNELADPTAELGQAARPDQVASKTTGPRNCVD